MNAGHLNREPLSTQIAQFYAHQIRVGDLAPGAQLPTVTQMCETWKVTPATVSKAMKILRVWQLVQTSRKGTFVADLAE